MKRNLVIILISIVLILAFITTPVLGKETQSNGQPFQEIWDAIDHLQQQIDSFLSQSGPTQEEFDALSVRVSELEAVVFNQPPIFESAPVLSAYEDASYTYNIVTDDPDAGNTITITANLLPPWLSLTDHSDGTATLTGTPTNEHVGTHSVILQAIDNMSDSTTQSFAITVLNTNDAPIFTSEPETVSMEGEAYTYAITTIDVDTGDVLTITAVLPEWLSLTDYGDGTAIIAGMPDDEEVGEHNIVLQVTDGSEVDIQEFTITVLNSNDPPVILTAIYDYYEISADSEYTIDISAEDEDGDQLELVIELWGTSQLPDWITVTNNGNNTWTLTCTPDIDDVGGWELIVFVHDGMAESYPYTFHIVVLN